MALHDPMERGGFTVYAGDRPECGQRDRQPHPAGSIRVRDPRLLPLPAPRLELLETMLDPHPQPVPGQYTAVTLVSVGVGAAENDRFKAFRVF